METENIKMEEAFLLTKNQGYPESLKSAEYECKSNMDESDSAGHKTSEEEDMEEVIVCSVSDETNKQSEEKDLNADTKMSSYTYKVDGQSYTVALDLDPYGNFTNNEKMSPKVVNSTINNSETMTFEPDANLGAVNSTDDANRDANSAMYSCNICSKQYRCPRSLRRHALSHSEKQHECEICGKRFAFRSYLTSHMKTHMKESFFCSFCDKRFDNMSSLRMHLPVHVVDRMLNLEKKYEHGNKGEVSDSAGEFDLSDENELCTKEVENEQPKRSSADEDVLPAKRKRMEENNLDDSFEQDEEFRKTDEYIQSVVSSGREKFANLKHLNFKEMAVLDEGVMLNKRVEQCEVGREMYIKTDGTEMYIKTEVIDDEEIQVNEDDKDGIKQPVSCGLCSETFNDPAELEIHMEMHKETDTYTYKVDGQDFTVSLGSSSGATNSLNKTTDKTTESPNEQSQGSQQMDTAISNNSTEDQPFRCHLCPKTYNRGNSLKRHLILHTGEKPHACSYCDKKFALMSYLTEHLKMHTGGLPFSCKICHKQFNRLANMKVHMGVHTKEKQVIAAVLPFNNAGGNQKTDNEPKNDLQNNSQVSHQQQLIDTAKLRHQQLTDTVKLHQQQLADAAKLRMQLQNQIMLQNNIVLPNISKHETQKSNRPIDSEEMSLFKPYMDNFLVDKQKENKCEQNSEKKQDDAQAESKFQEDVIPSQGNENKVNNEISVGDKGITQISPGYKNAYSDLISTQIMNIINSTPGTSKEGDAQMQLEDKSNGQGGEIITVKEEQPEEIGENSETDQTLYNYVIDGKTYTIPLETYTSLMNLDRRLALEDGGNTAFSHSFDIQANVDNETGKKTYSCELCFKAYSRSNSLRRHLLVHSGEKSYACDLCDKKFSIKSYLTAHRKIHSGETPFGCTFCFKKFNRVSNLRAHMLVHTGVKPHSCPVCGKLFNLSSNLKRHMTIHTGLKPHVCTVCSKEFGLSSSLKEHFRVHTGENPYRCDTCGKMFKQHSNFRRHKSIHTGEKRHVCYVCNKSFNQSSSLKRHLTIHPETAAYGDELVQDPEDYDEFSVKPTEENQSTDADISSEGNVTKEIPTENKSDKQNLGHEMSDDISETINRIVDSHASDVSTSNEGSSVSRISNYASVLHDVKETREMPDETQNDHLRLEAEKQSDKISETINAVAKLPASDISYSSEVTAMMKLPINPSVSSSENYVREMPVKVESSDISSKPHEMSDYIPETINPVVDSHAPDFGYPYGGNFMPRMSNEAYFGNPGAQNYVMPSFRMNIPIHTDGLQASSASFSLEKTVDKNIPPFAAENYWPTSNRVPVITDTSQENPSHENPSQENPFRTDMPFELSEEYKIRQQQWFDRKF